MKQELQISAFACWCDLKVSDLSICIYTIGFKDINSWFSSSSGMHLRLWAEKGRFWSSFSQYLGARVRDRITAIWRFLWRRDTGLSKCFCKWERHIVLRVSSFVLIFFHGLRYKNQRTAIHLSILNEMKATKMS